jgi:hypothetical protein
LKEGMDAPEDKVERGLEEEINAPGEKEEGVGNGNENGCT